MAPFWTLLVIICVKGITDVSSQPCEGGVFTCESSQEKIDCNQYCDFKVDCSDGSDEKACPASCNFDKGMCGWTQVEGDSGFDWRMWDSGNVDDGYSGPKTDRTSNSPSGGYLYLDGTFTDVSSSTALRSPTFSLAARTCKLTLWYHFFGAEYGDLEIRQVASGTTKHLYKVLDKVPALFKWSYAEVFLDPCVTNFQILLIGEDKQELPREGGLAIDDVAFQDCAFGPASPACDLGLQQCSGSNVCYPDHFRCDFTVDCCGGTPSDETACGDYNRCDFQEDLCDWEQLGDDDFDWKRHKGETSSDNTGPDYDHTTGTIDGYYIYIELSSDVSILQRARLGSYVIAGGALNCQLRFWYHMKGNFIGALRVYTRDSINGPMHQLWQETQDQRDPWLFKAIDISRNNDFQIIFEGSRGISVIGDISLDDISLSPGCVAAGRGLPMVTTLRPPFTLPGGDCDPAYFQCVTGQCVRGDAYCDFHFDCFDGSDESDCPIFCTFERDLCGWEQMKDDDFDWKVRDSASEMDVDFNGPVNDHSTKTPQGNYLYVGGNNLPGEGRKARLISPVYHKASRSCQFTFWFNMFGVEYGDLEVYIKTPAEGERRLRKELDGLSQLNKWHPGEADIDACTTEFQIIVEAEDSLKLPVQSGFAIDDFGFIDCEVPLPVPAGTCGTLEAQCSNGVCYPANQQCDFALDCCDGTDEIPSHCYSYNMCNFENGMCDWTNLNDDEFDWTRNKGGTGTSGTGPGVDHTLGTSEGYYMYIEVDRPRRPGDRARLGSYIIFKQYTETCTMRFFYHVEGAGVGELNVYTRTEVNGPLTPLWSRSQQRGDNWFYASVPLGIETQAFQVIIEGVRGVTQDGDISIDDISFTPGCTAAGYELPGVTTLAYTGTQGFNPCDENEFLCYEDYSCIDSGKVCDGAYDCPEGSDEDQGCNSPKPVDDSSNALVISMSVIFGTLGLVIIIGGIILFISKRNSKPAGLVENENSMDPYKSQSEI